MNLSLENYIFQIAQFPVLGVITFLVCGVIFFNGWSDMPNALTTCIATRSITPKKGLFWATIFNFLGIFIMARLSTNVAQTIFNIVSFGNDTEMALMALCSSLIAIVVWCLIAWLIGIPTSQNHALVAGLTGASIALNHGISGVHFEQWEKVLTGLLIATVGGFILAFIITKLIEKIFKNIDRRKALGFFKNTLVLGDMSMVFMNGAQDGQKLLALLVLAAFLSNGIGDAALVSIPVWMLFLCFIIMTVGLYVGGKKIIKNVGMKMAKVETYQGTAADVASFICLIIASFLGIPMSTTQTKTATVMGVGAAKRITSVDWSIVKSIIITWIVTFPGCGILGYIFTSIIMKIFA